MPGEHGENQAFRQNEREQIRFGNKMRFMFQSLLSWQSSAAGCEGKYLSAHKIFVRGVR